MQGFNNALQKLNDYLSVPSDGPEIVQASVRNLSGFKLSLGWLS